MMMPQQQQAAALAMARNGMPNAGSMQSMLGAFGGQQPSVAGLQSMLGQAGAQQPSVAGLQSAMGQASQLGQVPTGVPNASAQIAPMASLLSSLQNRSGQAPSVASLQSAMGQVGQLGQLPSMGASAAPPSPSPSPLMDGVSNYTGQPGTYQSGSANPYPYGQQSWQSPQSWQSWMSPQSWGLPQSWSPQSWMSQYGGGMGAMGGMGGMGNMGLPQQSPSPSGGAPPQQAGGTGAPAPRPMAAFGGPMMHHLSNRQGPMFGHNLNPIANGMHRLGMGNPYSMRPHFAPGGMPAAPGADPRAIQAAALLARQRALQGPQARGPMPQPQPRRAPNGDPIHTGALISKVPGRTDNLNISVPSGAYVIPADVVNHYGQDNTLAGFHAMEGLFRSGAIRKIHEQPGVQPNAEHLPIAAAGGEYVVAPEAVAHVGDGNLQKGHKVLDKFLEISRADHIKTQQKLPGPKKH